ncbi:MAG: hypothetical protein ACOC44_10315 [Promethearchaeia archaeon]
MNNGEKRGPLSREQLYKVRKTKIQNEIRAGRKILRRGVEPLKVADEFIHNSFELMKDRISKQNPGISDIELKKKIHNMLEVNQKLKSTPERGK